MKTGLLLAGIGMIMFLYSLIAYKRAHKKYGSLKGEDPVSYYLDLALELFPLPFWSAIGGVFLFISGLITILVCYVYQLVH